MARLIAKSMERLADGGGDIVGRGELMSVLGDRSHHVDDVQNLEPPLLGLFDRFLAGNHQDRHAAQLRVGGRRD